MCCGEEGGGAYYCHVLRGLVAALAGCWGVRRREGYKKYVIFRHCPLLRHVAVARLPPLLPDDAAHRLYKGKSSAVRSRVEDRRKRGQKPALVCFHRRPQLTMSCMQCRRPSLTAKATAQSRADQAKALRDALYKMSDTLVGSLVVVTVVDPKVQAAAKPAPTKGEFDQCFECAPDGSTSPIPTLSPSGTSWSSIAT